jgi:hypothetical protein
MPGLGGVERPARLGDGGGGADAGGLVEDPNTSDVPEIAIYLIKLLNDRLNLDLRPPHPLDNDTQGTLF